MNFAIFQDEDGMVLASVTESDRTDFKKEQPKNSGPIKLLAFEKIENYLGHNTADLADNLMALDEVMHGSMDAFLSGLICNAYELGRQHGRRRR
ncbi:MAG: hypothetical protein U0517_00270 [Candidatus Andersenbacteria bacterium]